MITLALAILASTTTAVVAAPSAEATGASVVLNGHGFGHGRGMGQYGAYGYAVDSGWSGDQILDHFFGGTRSGNVGNPEMTVQLTGFDRANAVGVTSSSDFWVGGPAGAVRVSGGSAATLTRSGSSWQLTTSRGGCGAGVDGGPWALPTVPEAAPTADPGADASRLLRFCANGTGYRGKLRMATDGGATRVVNVLDTESYLRGVVPRESPASWGDAAGGRGLEALKAQAVAARSYSISENRSPVAKTCDTQSCQVYGGAAQNNSWIEDGRTDRAIAGSAGQVRLRSGAVVRTEFSSSSGGYTAGGTFPAVIDTGDSRSPNASWTQTVDGSAISAAFPSIGTFSALQITSRNGLGADGGRVLTMNVVGTAGTVRTTGDAFRAALGLKSNWFTPVGPTERWWELRDGYDAGRAQHSVYYGGPNATTLSCDINGDQRSDLIAYENGTWYIRTSVDSGPATVFTYGAPGWIPVCGDWDGNGTSGIGVYNPATNTWYLRNIAGPGPADATFSYGFPGTIPVVGDWDGNGTKTIAVYDPSKGKWWMRNTNTPGPPNTITQYGFPGTTPAPGDFNGDRRTDLAVVANGRWYIRTSPGPGNPDRIVDYGLATDQPLTGNWDGTPGDGIGVSRPGRR